MGKKRHSVEQIIRLLRQAEVLSSQGKTVAEICREIGVSDNSYYTKKNSKKEWCKVWPKAKADRASTGIGT